MSAPENLLLRLVRVLGFFEKDIKLYLTLVRSGPLTAKELSKITGVPYSKLYSLMLRLQREGLITIETGKRPKVYKAQPPLKIFDRFRDIFNIMLKELQQIFEELQEQYMLAYKGVLVEKPAIVIEGDAIFKLILNMTMRAKRLLYIASPFKELLFTGHAKALSNVKAEVKVLVTPPVLREARDYVIMAKLSFEKIRVKEKMFGYGLISENEVLLVVKDRGMLKGMHSTYEYFIEIAKVYFDYLWADSKPFMLI
ncbi:MAG: hypothetical protein DRJ51_00075 [Thermoprotei archaeon]|nr:MAG: hypothetical protein DRJ51_00075 [Thermoprotei archaeon]RLF03518.1 MAG: hypothetical protein DRJ59_00405 [Thermoprotei archaeon]